MLKIALIIVSILLVGCFASSHTLLQIEKSSQAEEIDKKIQELKQEQIKLQQLQTEIDEKISKAKQTLNKEKIIVPAPPLPSPAPVLRAPSSTDHRDIREPVGSGKSVEARPIEIKPIPKTIDHSTVVGQLYSANSIFAIPNQANVSEEIKAQLIIDPVRTLDELKKEVTVGPIKSAEQIKISKIVIAKLDAPDFEIISSTEAEQAVAETEKTEWLWTLRPKSSGLHPVNVVVYAEVTIGSKTTKYRIRTFDKQVMIEITPIQKLSSWWEKYWQWVVVTLLLPFGKWLYDKKFNKNKE